MSRSPKARRRLALAALGLGALAALALALGATGRGDPAARLDRALAAMERIQGVRFELVAKVEASGPAAAAGPLRTDWRMTGRYQSPDRLHVSITSGPSRRELVIVGRRQWIDEGAGYHQTVAVPVGPLRDARAPLTFLRGGGAASFAGLGLAPWAVTYRVRLDLSAGDLAARIFGGDSVPPDARGVVEVEIGLLDGLIRRQTVLITTGTDPFSSGFDRVRTTYRVEYWDHGLAQEIREPE